MSAQLDLGSSGGCSRDGSNGRSPGCPEVVPTNVARSLWRRAGLSVGRHLRGSASPSAHASLDDEGGVDRASPLGWFRRGLSGARSTRARRIAGGPVCVGPFRPRWIGVRQVCRALGPGDSSARPRSSLRCVHRCPGGCVHRRRDLLGVDPCRSARIRKVHPGAWVDSDLEAAECHADHVGHRDGRHRWHRHVVSPLCFIPTQQRPVAIQGCWHHVGDLGDECDRCRGRSDRCGRLEARAISSHLESARNSRSLDGGRLGRRLRWGAHLVDLTGHPRPLVLRQRHRRDCGVTGPASDDRLRRLDGCGTGTWNLRCEQGCSEPRQVLTFGARIDSNQVRPPSPGQGRTSTVAHRTSWISDSGNAWAIRTLMSFSTRGLGSDESIGN